MKKKGALDEGNGEAESKVGPSFAGCVQTSATGPEEVVLCLHPASTAGLECSGPPGSTPEFSSSARSKLGSP